MLDPVNTSLPVADFHSGQIYQKSIVTLVALATFATIAVYVVRSLRGGRVQPSSPAGRLYYEGDNAHKDKRYQAAIDKFAEALKSKPDPLLTILIHLARSKSYTALGQPNDALKELEVVLACEHIRTEMRVSALISKGEIYAAQNDHEKAIIEYEAALNFEKNNPHILFRIGCSKTILGDFKGALDALTKGYELKSSDLDFQAHILTQRAKVYMGLNQLPDALADLKKALECDTQDIDLLREIHIRMGVIHDADGAFLYAIRAYLLALNCNPSPDERVSLLLKRAASKLAVELLDGAIEDLDEAWNLNPTDTNVRAGIRIQRGKIYQQQKKFNLAEPELTEAINCHPTENQADIYFVRGQVRVELKDYQPAIDDFSFAMTIVPPKCGARAEFLLHRGLAQEKNNSLEAAFLDWEEGLGCDLESGVVKAGLLYSAGVIYNKRKDYERAIKNTTSALKCEFDCKELERDLYRLRAAAHRNAKHFKEAIEDWDEALKFEFENPDDKAWILHARGLVFYENNELYKARQEWREALNYVTDENLRQVIVGRLDEKVTSITTLSLIAHWAWSKMTDSPFTSPKQ